MRIAGATGSAQRSLIAALALLAILAVPTTAAAHVTVTVTPGEAPAGSFTVLNVRVPHDRADNGTVKVDMRLPDGVYFLSYKKVPGWKVKLTRERLDKPVDLGGFSVSERFTRIVWEGNPKRGGIIRPDQFEEFPIFMRIPDGNPGDQLVSRRSRPTATASGWPGPAALTPTSPLRGSPSRRRSWVNEGLRTEARPGRGGRWCAARALSRRASVRFTHADGGSVVRQGRDRALATGSNPGPN